jgi:GT2 family glycosyltransferase
MVSIIIPYKEDRGWLHEAVKSVQMQTWRGSIELINCQSDNGVSYNINRGIEIAKGEYIKYLCEDDWLTPNCIKASIEAMRSYDFIHGNAYNIGGGIRQQKPIVEIPTLAEMLDFNVIHGGTLMYHKSVFDKVGLFDETLDCAEEYEFNLRCLSKGLKLGYCNQFLYNYRRHDKQKSLGNMDAEYQRERQRKIHKIKERYL